MSEKTYVHGEDEVRLTGRKAEKPAGPNKVMTLVEITPVNEWAGTWKKWVSPQVLFEIKD